MANKKVTKKLKEIPDTPFKPIKNPKRVIMELGEVIKDANKLITEAEEGKLDGGFGIYIYFDILNHLNRAYNLRDVEFEKDLEDFDEFMDASLLPKHLKKELKFSQKFRRY